MGLPYDKYASNDYLQHNPTWDIEDSPWKAVYVAKILRNVEFDIGTICEIGCGAGGVLAELRHSYPQVKLYGYDIAPDAARFWEKHEKSGISFQVGDFFVLNQKHYDVILLLDVIEHVADPFTFLFKLHGMAKYYVFHIPLDLSASSVVRERPLLNSRQEVGHINYFTKNLALSLLKECNFEIIKWQYSGAAFNSPQRTWKTRLASFPRRFLYVVNKDWGVRILGGETLFILAQDESPCDKN